MSNTEEKLKNSKRRFNDENSIKKQLKIANVYTRNSEYSKDLKQPHRMNKRHAMDCGNPSCGLCGNPRKLFNEKTIQEQRFYQDIETVRNIHSNGLDSKED